MPEHMWRNFETTGYFSLLTYDTSRGSPNCFRYRTTHTLAKALYGVVRHHFWLVPSITLIRALSPKGKVLSVSELTKAGFRQYLSEKQASMAVSAVGTVPGIHRRRSGHSYRKCKVSRDIRQAALVLSEEGEVAPRAARQLRRLRSLRNDVQVSSDTNWKSFRKGRKAWDR